MAVDSSAGLSDIGKFNYVRSLLEKSASEAIFGLTLTANNYKEAISILKRRLGNKQKIIAHHIDILLNVDAVSSQHNLKGLRHLYDMVETQVHGLRSLGVEPSLYSSLLSSALIRKIPPELQLVLSREVGDGSWTLDDLLKRLREEIEARERVGPQLTQPLKKPGRDGSISTAAALLSPNNPPPCCYCQQSHPSGSCESITNVEERKQILKRTGRCFVCLKKYHISRQCRSAIKCRRCGGKHHSSICTRAPHSSKPPQVQNSAAPQQVLNPRAEEFKSATTSMYANTNMGVLLQTARVQVFNPEQPQSPVTVRVILDGGSQRSYITCKARDTLHLPTVRQQRMLIKTFGSRLEEEHQCDVVKAAMKLKYLWMDLPIHVLYSEGNTSGSCS